MSTRYPIRDDVVVRCPKCNRDVWASRSVYPDEIYYTCHPHNHHFSVKNTGRIDGRKFPRAPKGWNDED